jgi:hypothetical protein
MKLKASLPACASLAGAAALLLTSPPSPARAGEIDAKATKNVIETPAASRFHVSLTSGYLSTYIFRGNDLTPNSDGEAFWNLDLRTPGFLKDDSFGLGIFGIHQLGEASKNYSFVDTQLTAAGLPVARDVRFRQRDFAEYDFYQSYRLQLGPVNLEVGNILFVLYRRDKQEFDFRFLPGSGFAGTITVPDNQKKTTEFIDRLYFALSTDKIPFVTPTLTYYQNVYNSTKFNDAAPPPARPFINLGAAGVFADPLFNAQNKVDRYAGYLEFKLRGNIPIIRTNNVLTFNPYFISSVSFGDRPEKANQGGFIFFNDDFHHIQAGLEATWRPTRYLSVTPYGFYVHLFQETFTDRTDNWIGGVRVSLGF